MVEFQTIKRRLTPVKALIQRFRTPLIIAFSILFVGLVSWAVSTLELRLSDIQPGPLLVNLLILNPLALVINGAGLTLIARAFKKTISLQTGIVTSSVGVLAGLLPAPGGLATRLVVMRNAGMTASGMIIGQTTVTAIRVGLVLLAACYAIAVHIGHAWILVAALGVVAVLGGILVLWRTCGLLHTLEIFIHRLIALLVDIARIWCAFAMIGMTIALFETPVFSAAAILGASAAIAPAGLGLSEALGAAAAPFLIISSAAAVTALASNRVMRIVSAGLMSLYSANKFSQETHHEA